MATTEISKIKDSNGDIHDIKDTTYTFTSGTNSFTYKSSYDSTATTVTVTPSITNNITGSGTSGYLTKFNGANTITNGPQLGSTTTTFLNNKGEWATPAGTYSLPTAAAATLGGVKVGTGLGISATGVLSHSAAPIGTTSSKGSSTARHYIKTITVDSLGHITGVTTGAETVTNTTYSAGSGLTLSGTTFSISSTSVTNAMLQNSSISIAGESVSLGGSLTAATLREKLSLSSALRFAGVTTTTMTDGRTTANVVINSTTVTPTTGDVVIYGDGEYVWTGSAWEHLGGDGSYKTVQSAVSDPTASGTSTSFIKTISQDANGVITASKASLPTGSTSVTGIVMLSSATNSTNEALAATPKAVKAAYDLAASKSATTGTVTSVRVQASSPLVSSVSGAQSGSLDTTISFSKTTANYVLAGPASGTTTAVPTLRALVAADLPVMVGASSTTAGTKGAVPAPATTDIDRYLRGNGTWSIIETNQLKRPTQLQGTNDVTIQPLINDNRANRLIFLPADQIIIEKTTDGGTTWVDAGVSDDIKVGLFSQTRPSVNIPLLSSKKNIKCGLRITFTAMKYNVPSGTAETQKYNYWNSSYVTSQERYNQIKEFYFWVNANSDGIKVKLEGATGGASTTWETLFENNNFCLRGWSGNNYISFSQRTFGGSTNQTSQNWNYRLTFFTCGPNATNTLSTSNTGTQQSILEIRAYGDTYWGAGNNLAARDHLYSWDYLQNATFPAKITATTFSGDGSELTNLNGSNISSGTIAAARLPTATTQAKGIMQVGSGLTVNSGTVSVTGSAIISGSQTTTSSADGGNNVYTFTTLSGTTSTFTVKNGTKGNTGDAAGFGTPTATVDTGTGTPSVTITTSGSNTAKVFNFAFSNLKGAKGDTGSDANVTAASVTGALGYTPLQSHQTIKANGLTGASINRYGVCSTSAGTAAKTVSVTTGTFALETGAQVTVKFNNANTANSPTLNVASKGAKNIFHRGAQITSGSNKALLTGVCDFVYDGTQWHLIGNYYDSNTDTKVNVTLATTSKAYLLGVTTAPTATTAAMAAVSDTGVYLDTTAGKLTATSFSGNGSALTNLNANNLASGTVPAARLPGMVGASSTTAGTKGAVPAPATGDIAKFLKGDGTWGTPTFTLPQATTDTLGGVTVGSNITVNSGAISLSGTNVKNALGKTTANYVLAGPSSGTTTAVPTLRKLVAADIPISTTNAIGGVSVAASGTSHLTLSSAGALSLTKANVTAALGFTPDDAGKVGSSNVGSNIKPIYLNAGTPTAVNTPTSGAYFSTVPQIGADGVMEIGKYIDFHATSNSTSDYDFRLTASSQNLALSGTLTFTTASYGTTLPSSGITGQIFFKKHV